MKKPFIHTPPLDKCWAGGMLISTLFLFPPSRGDYAFRFHLGVGYIQAYLKSNGIDSFQFLPKGRKTIPNLAEEILRMKPEVVGFTCFDSNYYMIKCIAKVLKKRKRALPIIVGGPTATFSDEFVLRDCIDIDACVRGEGEETVFELLRSSLTDLYKIKGITFRQGNTINRTADRQLISSGEKGAELDILPSPYLNEVAPLNGEPGVLTSRGCFYECTFCNFSAMSRHSVRFHSVNRVIAELHKINDHVRENLPDQPLIQFADDAFSLNIKRAKEICRRIIDEKMELSFYADTRADFCDAELLGLMREAGFREINFGLESAVPEVLRTIKKVCSSKRPGLVPELQFLRRLKENVRLARNLGFHTSVSVVLGLPGETKEDGRKTLKTVKDLNISEYSHNFLKIHGGTELQETRSTYGLDVKKSATILPLETVFAYDVFSLDPLPNASLYNNVIQDESTYLELIANTLAQVEDKDWSNVFVDFVTVNDTIASWLVKTATVPFSVYFNNADHRLTRELAERHISELVRHGVPVGNFYFTERTLAKKKGKTTYKLARFGDLIWSLSAFAEIPLSKYEGQVFLPQAANVILTINDKKDVEALTNLAKESVSSESAHLDEPFPLLCIKDECRWASEPCPATYLQRLMLRQDYSISPCFNGNAFGTVHSDREEIEANSRRIWEQELSRRNCNECPAKANCSKCLFPFPLTVKDYCFLRRTHPEIGDFTSLLRVARTLSRGRKQSDARTIRKLSLELGRKSGKLPMSKLKDEIKLAKIGRKRFAINLKTQKVFILNKSTGTILSSLLKGDDPERLANSLRRNFRTKGKDDVDSFVESALKVLERKGFLESSHDGSTTRADMPSSSFSRHHSRGSI